MKPLRFAFAAFALLPAFALSACNDQSSKAETKPQGRPVLVQKIEYAPVVAERSFVATIRPRHESDLGFRVGGKVAKRLVDVGQRVKAGDALATLDEIDIRLQKEQADAEMSAAKGALAQARSEMNRVNELRKQGWSTESNADRQRAALDEAQGRLTRAERALSLANNSLGYATLRADADGIVTATQIEPGQVVAAGQAAIRVARLTEREALVAVPESLVERVRNGQAKLSLWSAPERNYRAVLRELAPAADAATRTYAARFSLPDAGDEMQWGMTATLTLTEKDNAKVARVPLSALVNEGKGPGLYVVDKATGSLALKPVEVMRFDAREALLTSGVEEGALVVALGVQKLDPAQKVRVVDNLAF